MDFFFGGGYTKDAAISIYTSFFYITKGEHEQSKP